MDEVNKENEEMTEELPVVEEIKKEDTHVHMTPIDVDEGEVEEPPLEIGIPKKKEAPIQEETKEKPRKPLSKKWLIVAVVLIVSCVGVFFYVQYQKEQQARQKAYDKVYNQLKVTFKQEEKDEDGNIKDLTIYEYGTEGLDPLQLVDTHYGDVSCSPKVVDTSKVGTQKITYTVSMKDSYDQQVTKQFELDVKVNDTQSPKIEVENSKLTITEGDAFDPKENIVSVSDAIDGSLEYVEEEPEKISEQAPFYQSGWYMYTTDVDTDVPGTYHVRIKACDINGNATDASYQVTVKKKDPTSFMTIGTKTYTEALSQMTSTDDTPADASGSWEDLDSYLGNVLYRSEQFTSQDAMMSQAKTYTEKNFSELTKNKAHESRPILGSISIDTVSATVYYMSALNEDGDVMYYFFAIV